MPFLSKSQNRACWAQYNRDIKAGRKPKWDCKEFAKYTDYSSLPEKVRATFSSGLIKTKYGPRKVRIGPRGGVYVVVGGEKKYL